MSNVEVWKRCALPFNILNGRIPFFDILRFLVRHSIFPWIFAAEQRSV
jgi:hypothetical protein